MSRETVRRAFQRLVTRARSLGLLQGAVRLSWGRADEFPALRDHAFTDGRTVWVAPKLAGASAARVRGLLAHELGHVVALRAGLDEHREVDADRIGSEILGTSVGYDRQDIQCAGLRRPRPSYLPNPKR